MGLLSSIFGSSEHTDDKKNRQAKTLPWQALTDVAQLDDIEKRSQSKAQVIFKHSTTCGISKMAMRQFVGSYDLDANLDLYYLDLLNYREVSNEVGYKFQVIHQSPQLLVIKNGTAVAHGSHGGVNEIELSKYE
ncbi:MAG: bacillithiol system redox-active protein YtxJ [Psychroserpens sp.]|uniref:bacillithiol system redox-active protein YtxJ n=1 Tax=Psychroserpens sp. TaxID=2020870 RepID=UPI003C75FC71